MTGAGSSSVAFVKETAFKTLPGTPTYYLPGRNPTAEEISITNALERMDIPQEPEAVESVAGLFDGAFTASWTMSADTHQHVRDIVFNDAGGGFKTGPATTSRWYLGTKYLSSNSTSTYERELKGVIPLDYEIQYDVNTNTIRETLTAGYADEAGASSLTPGSITKPTGGSDVPFHGASLSVDAVTVEKLQSCTLSFSSISRFQNGPNRTPVDATLANPRTTLDATAIFNGSEFTELAYGGAGATSIQDRVDSVAGSLTFDAEGSTVATYTLPKLQVESGSWDSLVDAENDLTEPTTFHVNGGVSVN